MTAAEILARLRSQGITVAMVDGRVVLRGDPAVLTTDLVAGAREVRDDILALLRSESDRVRSGPLVERWVNPDRGAEDLALLRAADRLVLLEAGEIGACHGCRRPAWWRSRHGLLICRICHPPAPGAEAAS